VVLFFSYCLVQFPPPIPSRFPAMFSLSEKFLGLFFFFFVPGFGSSIAFFCLFFPPPVHVPPLSEAPPFWMKTVPFRLPPDAVPKNEQGLFLLLRLPYKKRTVFSFVFYTFWISFFSFSIISLLVPTNPVFPRQVKKCFSLRSY